MIVVVPVHRYAKGGLMAESNLEATEAPSTEPDTGPDVQQDGNFEGNY
jgi:hypothetical protein